MFSKKIILSAISSLFVLATVNSYAAQTPVSSEIVAREASEGPRGADHPTGTHKLGIDAGDFILARRGADDPVPHPRGEGVGHPNSVDVNSMILARRGADDPVPHPRGEGVGHPNSVDVGSFVIAREAAEGPRGADNNNQRRRGRNGVSEDVGSFVIAREASEGPRGADNNNQRRRGRA